MFSARTRYGALFVTIFAATALAQSAFASTDSFKSLAPDEIKKFEVSPSAYLAAYKGEDLSEKAYELAYSDIDVVADIVAYFDSASADDKRLMAFGLGRAAKAYSEDKQPEKAMRIQQAIARQSEDVRTAFNMGAGQKVLAVVTSGAAAGGGGGAVQTDPVFRSTDNSGTPANASFLATSDPGSLVSGGGGGGSGGGSSGGGSSGGFGSISIVITNVNYNKNTIGNGCNCSCLPVSY